MGADARLGECSGVGTVVQRTVWGESVVIRVGKEVVQREDCAKTELERVLQERSLRAVVVLVVVVEVEEEVGG